VRRYLRRRRNDVDAGRCNRGSRHPLSSCGGWILRKGDPASTTYRTNPERAVRASARKDNADGAILLHLGQRAEQRIDRQRRAIVWITRNQFEMPVRKGHLRIRCYHVSVVHFDAVAIRRLVNRDRGLACEQLGEDASVRRTEMLYDYVRKRGVSRHVPKELRECFEPTGRCANPDDSYGRISQ
jgi:hypothetical protein